MFWGKDIGYWRGEMIVIHTNKALAEDFLDYFQGINYSLCWLLSRVEKELPTLK